MQATAGNYDCLSAAADAAYTEYHWEDYLIGENKFKLLHNRKNNSKRIDLLAAQRLQIFPAVLICFIRIVLTS